MSITQSLVVAAKHILSQRDDMILTDLRLGLGYSLAELSNSYFGLGCTPADIRCNSCTKLVKAGHMRGMKAFDLADFLLSDNHLERMVGLAVINAVSATVDRDYIEHETISQLKLSPEDKVVMIGYFSPLISRIQASGCALDIVELKTDIPDTIRSNKGFEALRACDVALITATSIINGTFDDLCSNLKVNREAVVLGPSTPLLSEAFSGTRISRLAGSLVKDPDKLKIVISEGGGTMSMKNYLNFVTVMI